MKKKLFMTGNVIWKPYNSRISSCTVDYLFNARGVTFFGITINWALILHFQKNVPFSKNLPFSKNIPFSKKLPFSKNICFISKLTLLHFLTGVKYGIYGKLSFCLYLQAWLILLKAHPLLVLRKRRRRRTNNESPPSF